MCPAQSHQHPSRSHSVYPEPQNSQFKWQIEQENSQLSLDDVTSRLSERRVVELSNYFISIFLESIHLLSIQLLSPFISSYI